MKILVTAQPTVIPSHALSEAEGAAKNLRPRNETPSFHSGQALRFAQGDKVPE
jgi:hypothetical protein